MDDDGTDDADDVTDCCFFGVDITDVGAFDVREVERVGVLE